MTVRLSSRYRYGLLSYISLEEDGDTFPVVRYRPTVDSTIETTPHTCSFGERLDTIANSVYGDSSQWWRIAELNPHVNHLAVLKPGQRIRIPR